jgi:hypothetical protein
VDDGSANSTKSSREERVPVRLELSTKVLRGRLCFVQMQPLALLACADGWLLKTATAGMHYSTWVGIDAGHAW